MKHESFTLVASRKSVVYEMFETIIIVCPLFSLSLFRSVVLKLYSLNFTIMLLQCKLLVQWSYMIWSNIRDCFNLSLLLMSFAFFSTFPPHRVLFVCLSLAFGYPFLLFLRIEKQLCSSFFSPVVSWTPLFMYLITSLKCLAQLQGRFCNFACLTNAS